MEREREKERERRKRDEIINGEKERIYFFDVFFSFRSF